LKLPDRSTIIIIVVNRGEAALKEKKKLIRWCDKRLKKDYGDKVLPRVRKDPLDELVLTVLSQNTNDLNRDRAYAELRARFPRWEDVLCAPVKRIEAAIRVGGLAGQKSARIKAMLGLIKEREGKLELGRICGMPEEDALHYLYSMKGVGEKTAACVLLFSCGKPVFPVDTHILRVSKRLWLVPEKAGAKEAHKIMGEMVPKKAVYRFHLNVIEHGRRTCHPRKPECSACCLNEKCPSAHRIGS